MTVLPLPADNHANAAATEQAFWKWPAAPQPFPVLELLEGNQGEISLADYTAAGWMVDEAVVADGLSVSLPKDNEWPPRMVIANESAKEGYHQNALILKNEKGENLNVGFAVLVEDRQPVSFEFKPAAGAKVPNKVNVAGEFNGWNQGANEMVAGEDGVFRTTIQIDPGTYKYKLVVDGEWIADPSNPKTDGTGFNNSVLEVAGSVLAPLKAHPLAQTKKGRDQPVEVQAVLKDDELLVAEKSIILINNQLVGGDRVDIDEKTGRITLYPSGEWDATNWLTLVLKASTGRQGHFIFPLDWSDAERSPRDEIIYNTITDRFADGNPDNTKPVKGEEEIHPLANYYGGDWRGIINKIEEGYFTKLGVTTLWISPMNKNPEGALKESVPPFGWYTGYHGYWPISATETHASYGTMDDLKELVATAHKHGIAILLDFVVNHVHEDHALIKENPTWAVPENTPDGRPNIRLFDEFPFTTWFETYLPTLEFNNNPELVKFMTDNAIYWLSETGADGFRLDAVKHVPHSFWVSLNEAMTERFGEQEGRLIYTVGESISSRGTINEFLGPDMLSGQFDFPLYWKIEEVFAKGAGSLAEALEEALKSQQNYLPGSIMSPLVGNHDIIRFMGWADDDIPEGMEQKEIGFKIPPVVNSPVSYRKMQSAFAFLFSLPGAPMVYYGDEIGLTGAHDPDNRRPMIWDDWSDDQQATFDQASALMAARHDSIALRRGYLIPVQASDEMIAFLRVSPEEQVLTVIGRKVEGKTFDISLPESHLNASELHPLHLNDISASLENQKLTITFEADWSFGLLKLK